MKASATLNQNVSSLALAVSASLGMKYGICQNQKGINKLLDKYNKLNVAKKYIKNKCNH